MKQSNPSSASFDACWEHIYAQGQQFNKYPYDEVVSFIFKYAPRNSDKANINILEIGCGAGNNLWFAAREGFSVTGIDASPSAISYAKSRFEQDRLHGHFEVRDFTNLHLENNSFDLAIDRAALTHTTETHAREAVSEIHRVLKPGGIFFSQLFGDEALLFGEQGADDVIFNVKGVYANVGQVRLYNWFKIRDLFVERDWDFIECYKLTKQSQLEERRFVTWQIVVKKCQPQSEN